MLEALFPKTRRKLLILLLTHPDKGYHLRKLVRLLDCGKGAVERELANLLSVGVIQLSRQGNLTVYSANRSSPVYPELYGLVMKTDGFADVIRCALKALDGIELAFIFGSIASGNADRLSDIDVLIVGNLPFADVSAAFMDAQQQLGREVAPTVYSSREFQQRLLEDHHFLRRILSGPKIMLIGDLDDIERMGRASSG